MVAEIGKKNPPTCMIHDSSCPAIFLNVSISWLNMQINLLFVQSQPTVHQTKAPLQERLIHWAPHMNYFTVLYVASPHTYLHNRFVNLLVCSVTSISHKGLATEQQSNEAAKKATKSKKVSRAL